jgi:hypothetical protein
MEIHEKCRSSQTRQNGRFRSATPDAACAASEMPSSTQINLHHAVCNPLQVLFQFAFVRSCSHDIAIIGVEGGQFAFHQVFVFVQDDVSHG